MKIFFTTLLLSILIPKYQQFVITNGPVLSFETFSELPKVIDGCSCNFSKNIKDFKSNKFIYANDFAEIGFIKVNKKMIKLKLVNATEKAYNYANKDYKLRIDIQQEKEVGEEANELMGTITLTTKTGQKISTNFVGECGC